jgi:hypothetical protein
MATKREEQFTGAGVSLTENADGTETVTIPGAGGALAGDTTGPSGANITTGLHNVVNWQAATLDTGATLAGGAAIAPPATPETYVQITINGVSLFIPAYHKGS